MVKGDEKKPKVITQKRLLSFRKNKKQTNYSAIDGALVSCQRTPARPLLEVYWYGKFIHLIYLGV